MKQDPQTNNNVRFIGIGSVKCATTWISRCLKSHPEICMPDHKELKFFNRRDQYSQGINHYANQFAHCDGAKAVGEFTPRYLHDGPEVAKRIHDAFPDAKLIVCLRDPIERALSHHAYAKRKRNVVSASFEDAMKERPDFVEWGLYYKQLKPYFDLFPRERILVLQYENIRRNELEFMKKVYRFLDVDESHVSPHLKKHVNKTSDISYRFSFLNRFLQKIKTRLRSNSWGGYKLIILIQKSGLSRLATATLRMNRKTVRGANAEAVPGMQDETKSRLREFYREDIQQLEKLVHIDRSLWST